MEAISNALSSFIDRTKDSPVQSLLVASAVALVGVGAASYSGLLGSKQEESLAPAIDEETTRKIMKQILEGVHLNLPGLFQYAERIKQSIAAQGQEIDDAILLKTFLLPNLENLLRQVQDKALEDFDVDEDELEEAVTEYCKQGDADLIKTSATIRSIFKRFGANIVDEEEEEEEEPAAAKASANATAETTVSKKSSKKSKKSPSKDMPLEEFLQFMRTFQTIQLELTKSTIEDFVEEFGRQLDQTTAQLFQQRMFIAAQQAQEEITQDFGIEPETIEKLIMKYQREPAVLQLQAEFEEKTIEVMQASGLGGFMQV